ncbi:hypothetical protein CY34DRAFT_59040, partial [Suillus luteus UH-Slu-Lm8-n1]
YADPVNIAYDLYNIYAFSLFNLMTGSHLILVDIKIVVEFPSNSTIQISSTV